jgi:1-acyl-sn-glycerol-3-phosphate acyltransferase
MRIVRTLRRLFRTLEHLTSGATIALLLVVGGHLGWHPGWRSAVVRWWHARLCRALELRVRVAGRPANNALLVANHISWLDIPVLGAQGEIGFLSKAQVRAWPLIGWLAKVAGTLFIERGANRARVLIRQIELRIRGQGRIAIFPEGTTTDGTSVKRFHPRLLAAAEQPDLWIQPVAFRYGSLISPDPVAPFVGDDDLIRHLWRVLRHPGLEVTLTFMPPFQLGSLDRRRAAERCREAVVEALNLDLAAKGEQRPDSLIRRHPESVFSPDAPLSEAN